MILDLHQLFVLAVICASLHWIFARSKIMKFFWGRATGWFGAWLACPACFGMWIGMALGLAGLRPVSLCTADEATLWSQGLEIAQAGLLGTWLTPVFEAVLLWGLRESAIDDHTGLFDDVDKS